MLSEIRQHLESSNLKHLFGEFKSGQWNLDSITVKQRTKALKEPTIATTGVGAESTGGHYDLIVLDDLVGLQNYFSKDLRDKTFAFYRSMKNLMEPGRGQIVVFGTRWHLDDLYAQIIDIESKYYDIVVREIEEDGKIIFPKKFNLRFNSTSKSWERSAVPTTDYLDYLKTTMPLWEFSAQYKNNPIDADSADFKTNQIRFYDPTQRHPNHMIGIVDPAASLSKSADFTAMGVMGQYDNRMIRLAWAWHGKVIPQELINKIFEMVNMFKLNTVVVESFAYQKTLKHYINEEMRKRNCFFNVTEVGRAGMRQDNPINKEARIRRLQPFFEQGLIEIPPGCDWLKEELLSFPRGRHDDGLDVMAHGLDYIVPSGGAAPPTQQAKEGTIGDLLKRTWERGSGEVYGEYMRDLKYPVEYPVVVGGA